MNPAIQNLRNLTRPYDRPLLDVGLKGCDVIQLVLVLEAVLRRNLLHEREHEGHARIAVLVLKEPFPAGAMYCTCQPIAYRFTAEEFRAMRECIDALCLRMAENVDEQADDLQQLAVQDYERLRKLYTLVRTPVAEGGAS